MREDGLPHLVRAVGAAAGQRLAVRAETDAMDGGRVAPEGDTPERGLGVPQLARCAPAAGSPGRAVGAEGQGGEGARVSRGCGAFLAAVRVLAGGGVEQTRLALLAEALGDTV